MKRKRKSTRLSLELLEARDVPATFYWDGAGATNSVQNMANWRQVGAPGNDVYVFDGAAGVSPNKNAEFDLANGTYNRVEVRPGYGGTVFIKQDTTVTNLQQGTGRITVDTGKILSANQVVNLGWVVDGGGKFALTGAAPRLTVAANSDYAVSEIKVPVGGVMDIQGLTHLRANTVLTQEGTLNWSNGTVNLWAGSLINNSGTVDITATGNMLGGGTVINTGLIKKTGGGLANIISAATNSGAGLRVQVDGGTLRLGTNTGGENGTSTVAAGATLDWLGRAVGSAGVTGAGTLRIGAMANTLAVDVAGSLNVSVGAVEIVAGGELKGSGTVSIGSNTVWAGGKITGLGTPASPIFTGSMTISGNDLKTLDNTTLERYASTVWTGGNITLSGTGSIKNYASFSIQGDDTVAYANEMVDTGSFQNLVSGSNRGLVSKSGGNASTTFQVPFSNAGDLHFLGRNITFKKALTTQAGGKIDLLGGTMDMFGQTLTITAGELSGLGTIVGDVTMTGGMLHVLGTLNVQGKFTQGASATLDFIFLGAWPVLAATKEVVLNGALSVSVEDGTPDDVWTDIVTSPLSLTNNLTGPLPAGYELRDVPVGAPTKLQIRKP